MATIDLDLPVGDILQELDLLKHGLVLAHVEEDGSP